MLRHPTRIYIVYILFGVYLKKRHRKHTEHLCIREWPHFLWEDAEKLCLCRRKASLWLTGDALTCWTGRKTENLLKQERGYTEVRWECVQETSSGWCVPLPVSWSWLCWCWPRPLCHCVLWASLSDPIPSTLAHRPTGYHHWPHPT